MELYKRFPKLTALWCCIEIMLYPGQLYGWSSILYVLKQEGLYINLCELETPEPLTNFSLPTTQIVILQLNTTEKLNVVGAYKNIALQPNDVSKFGGTGNVKPDHLTETVLYNLSSESATQSQIESPLLDFGLLKVNDIFEETVDKYIHHSHYTNLSVTTEDVTNDGNAVDTDKGCFVQDARLNLWFSIALAFSYVMCAFLGPLITKIGMRFFRIFFMVIYVIGILCLGFASTVSPWLVCPGLCCVGISGMAIYATSIQVSFLFPTIQSTITAVLVGMFDISSIVMQLMKVGFENGVSRRTFCIALAALHIVLVGISTCFLLPTRRIVPSSVHKGHKKEIPKNVQEKVKFLEEDHVSENKEKTTMSLREITLSSFFILHVFWMAVKVLRFVTYIGLLNAWIQALFNKDTEKEGYFLSVFFYITFGTIISESYFVSVFSYITFGTIISGLSAGTVHDLQRRKYADDVKFRREKMPIVVPFLMTTAMSLTATAFTLVKHEAGLYISFIMFTLYRTYVYSYELTFLSDAFPLIHFTMLYGIIQSFAGLVGLLQYVLFSWYEAYFSAPLHVNLVLLVLELSTLAHPFNIWYQCRKHRNDSKTSSIHRKSIHIDSKTANV